MGILLGNISRHSWRARDAEYADSNGRLLIADRDNRMERLDSEFNPLEVDSSDGEVRSKTLGISKTIALR